MGVRNPGLDQAQMAIVSHQDDDILFMSRDLQAQINSGNPMTTVFMTAGDAGLDPNYWQERENGAKAAYAEMAGYDAWVDETIQIIVDGEIFEVATSFLADRPEIRLYFLRLPDGPGGNGTETQGYQSLEKLWMGEIDQLTSVDGTSEYSRQDLLDVLNVLMDTHQPGGLMVQDPYSRYSAGDHSDHQYAARFSMLAQQYYDAPHTVTSYIGYAIRNLPETVFGADYERSLSIFREYAVHDYRTIRGYDMDGTPLVLRSYEGYLARQHVVDDYGTYWLNEFGVLSGSWSRTNTERLLADVSGDGVADLVGFGTTGVRVSGATMIGFNESREWSADFTQRAGWRVTRHERELGDVDGDGRADVVAFGEHGAYVALSNGAGFDAGQLWLNDFGYVAGWRVGRNERLVADVNGDGLDDIVGFAAQGVRVGLSDGTAFGRGTLWTDEFMFRAANIDPTRHEREAADVNGDGRADLILFGEQGAYVALSNGTGFDAAELWINNFGAQPGYGGWKVGTNERHVADVNGDGMADIVGFGAGGVWVALSNGHSFEPGTRWQVGAFARAENWDPARHLRQVADVNGDGMADIVWVDDYGARVSISTGNSFVLQTYDDFVF